MMLVAKILFPLILVNFVSTQELDFVSDLALERALKVDPISLAAVGRVARLGELYDGRIDKFLHVSLVGGNSSSLIQTTQNRYSNLKYLKLNTIAEKMEHLDVQAGLKLSVLFGLFEVSGSGKYLRDKQRSFKSVKVSVANFVTTVFEQIDIAGAEGRKMIDLDILDKVDATHVVVGIQWGGNVIVSVEDYNIDEKDVQSIRGSLFGKLEFGVAAISIEGSANISDVERNELNQFNFELYGDVLPNETPTTVVGAIILMKSVPKLLAEGNDGKGKALSYSLLPITLFRELLSIEADVNALVKYIDESTVNSCVKLFEEMRNDELKINDLISDINYFRNFIAKEKIDRIVAFSNKHQLYQNELKSRLSAHLILIRSGDQNVNKLNKALDEAYNHELSPNNIDFDQFSLIKTEFKFMKYIKTDLAVHMLDKDTSFQEFMSKNYNKNIYALFYSSEFPYLTEEPMVAFREILNKRETLTDDVVLAIKIDVLNEIERRTYFNFDEPTRLRLFKNGVCLIENYRIDGNENPPDQPELWSFQYMQTLVAELWDQSKTKPEPSVPIGFVYIQVCGQPAPSDIWPTFTWTNISPQLKGLFFRVEGGSASSFNTIQNDATRQITKVQNTWAFIHNGFPNPMTLPRTGWSPYGHTGFYPNNCPYSEGLRFYTSDDEVRPRNTAMRIWKRTA